MWSLAVNTHTQRNSPQVISCNEASPDAASLICWTRFSILVYQTRFGLKPFYNRAKLQYIAEGEKKNEHDLSRVFSIALKEYLLLGRGSYVAGNKEAFLKWDFVGLWRLWVKMSISEVSVSAQMSLPAVLARVSIK